MKRRSRLALTPAFAAVACVLACVATAQEPATRVATISQHARERAPGFARKPEVRSQTSAVSGRDAWIVSFACDAPCDATVSVVDGNGRIVRHLASGVLGPNAPEPFRKDTLAQEIEWDGSDDSGCRLSVFDIREGSPTSEAGKREPKTENRKPFRVRVSLGLRPVFARMLFEQPQGLSSRGPLGLAVDKDGLLYVEEGDAYVLDNGLAGALQKLNLKVFDGDGNYRRSLSPFRGDLPPEKVSAVRFQTTRDGRRIPLALSGGNYSYGGFLPGAGRTVRNSPVILSDGRLIYPCGTMVQDRRRLLVVGTDGSALTETFAGPPLQAEAKACAQIFLALSPDEKQLYFAGARSKCPKGSTLCHAVYRTAPDARDFARPFIGKEFESGNAEGQFNDPRGLATDAAGRLYVCDYLNDRVQVFAADGRFLKAFAVPGPDQICVHRKTGAIYVLSVRDRGATSSGWGVSWENQEDKSLVKFASFDDGREAARLDLPKRKNYMHDPGPMLALDATREAPVLWLAIPSGGEGLDFVWKIGDRGGTLARVPHKMHLEKGHGAGTPPMAADLAGNRLIAGNQLIDPATGRAATIELEGEAGRAALQGLQFMSVGPDGLIYYRSSIELPKFEKAWRIRRFTAEGKHVPFKDGREYIECNANRAITPFNNQGSHFDVGPDNRIYVVSAESRTNRNVNVDVYGPGGELVRRALIAMTKSGGCVRIDPANRIFASDAVRPEAQLIPSWYDADPLGQHARWYGSVFRFGSEGGGVTPAEGGSAVYLAGGMSEKLKPVKIAGARWGFYGLAPMPLQTGCQCAVENVGFDVDGWGRVWVPDAPGYCVAVLDCAGNVVIRFGAYGNRDATGAGGAVPEPPIPFWYPHDVAALDHDAFVRDMLAGRTVQVRLEYAQRADALVP